MTRPASRFAKGPAGSGHGMRRALGSRTVKAAAAAEHHARHPGADDVFILILAGLQMQPIVFLPVSDFGALPGFGTGPRLPA